jgi:serine/threonine protein kinase
MSRSYGAVYRAINKNNSDEVAVKILPAQDDMTKIDMEIKFLRRLASPYIVSYVDGYLFESELWV